MLHLLFVRRAELTRPLTRETRRIRGTHRETGNASKNVGPFRASERPAPRDASGSRTKPVQLRNESGRGRARRVREPFGMVHQHYRIDRRFRFAFVLTAAGIAGSACSGSDWTVTQLGGNG